MKSVAVELADEHAGATGCSGDRCCVPTQNGIAKPVHEAAGAHYSSAFDCADHGNGAVHRQRDRLFHEQVNSCRRRFFDLAVVSMRGQGDNQQVEAVLLEHAVEVCAGYAAEFCRELGGLRFRAAAAGDELQSQGCHGTRVPSSDTAGAYDALSQSARGPSCGPVLGLSLLFPAVFLVARPKKTNKTLLRSPTWIG